MVDDLGCGGMVWKSGGGVSECWVVFKGCVVCSQEVPYIPT